MLCDRTMLSAVVRFDRRTLAAKPALWRQSPAAKHVARVAQNRAADCHVSMVSCIVQGRQATVFARDQPIGQFGIIHPEVNASLLKQIMAEVLRGT